jgi:Beta-propeller repeat/Abnormal spindle-like microcephaly-assoc'd, ASPM-SPD-2-Hydin
LRTGPQYQHVVTKINTNATGGFKVGTGATIGGTGDDWALAIGGTGEDWPSAIAVDGSGNAYITGYTQSNDFPTVNALQRYRSGGMDAFVSKISPNSSLVYSTYLGGHSDDSGLGIAVTPNGNAYVVGQTSSTGFNKSPIAYQATFGGATDAFVTKIASRTFVSVAPATLAFGRPLVDSESAGKKITVTNNKASPLTVRSIHLEGVNAADFAQVNTCPASLAAGTTCDVWVTFKPSAKGTRKGFLVMNDYDPASPQAVALSGTGSVVSLSPKTLSFGSQAVGTTTAARTSILTNTDTAVLNVSGISAGINARDFVLSSDCGASVGGGASCKIDVTFKPTAKGSRKATVNINDDGGGSPRKITLSGTGT